MKNKESSQIKDLALCTIKNDSEKRRGMESKVKLQEKEQFPRKKRNRAKLIIATLIILFGGIAVGVYTFMNTPQMKAASIIDKVRKFKTAEGDFQINGIINIPSFVQAETINVKVDGKATITRSKDIEKYVEIIALPQLSGDQQIQSVLEKEQINSEQIFVLTHDFIFLWQGGKRNQTYKLTEKQIKPIKSFFENGENSQTDEQKAIQELQKFLLKGYTPPITNEGNKTVINIDRVEIDKMIENVSKNIATDSNYFEELVKKTTVQLSEIDVSALVKEAKDKTLLKHFKAIAGLEQLQCKMIFEELGNEIKQSTEINITLKQQTKVTLNVKLKIKNEMNYKI